MPDWNKHFNLCKKANDERRFALANELLRKAQDDIAQNEKADWNWFVESLNDSEKKYFVAAVLKYASIPKFLLPVMLQTAVSETNPSSNKDFLMPCVATYGKEKVHNLLMEISNNGTEAERQGVERLLYWMNYPEFKKSGV